jgi:uncharacterized protein (DUF1501 family)
MMNRRALLRSLCLGGGRASSLVVVFLRGGADGLNLVVPREEKNYFFYRPTLAVRDSLPLDGPFGLHPSLGALQPLFQEGRLAIVHAVGSDDDTRSHFEAQDLMERAGRPGDGVSGGWLARHLRSRPGGTGALSAVALGRTMPESLRGAPSACTMESIEEVSLPEAGPAFTRALRVLYESEPSGVGKAGRATFRLLERLHAARGAARSEAAYPEGEFGRGLSEIARLIRAEVGLDAACMDYGGWDTHFVQNAGFAAHVKTLGEGLAAFAADLGSRMERTLVVVLTEFGRRAYENGTLGTDHGRASVMFAMGGRIRGGRVITEWPGLEGGLLDGPGDLKVTIDYRDVLGELLERELGNPKLDAVFPGHRPRFRGLVG